MDVNKKEQAPNRIPIRFVDEQDSSGEQEQGGSLTPEEIGQQSSYEDEAEVQRRIDRGSEQDDARGRERANDEDAAGSPHPSDLPEHRNDTDTRATKPLSSASHAADETSDTSTTIDSSASSAAKTTAAGPLLAELIAARAEFKRLEIERADLLDKLARRQADFENYRKRTERERGESHNRIVADVVSNLLPVLDNLRRALDAESSLQSSESEEFRHFLHGVELVSKQLCDVLEGLGLRPVEALGQRFDPHLHEAVTTESTNDYEPDMIMQELLRGYVLGEKLLRPAMVKVATRYPDETIKEEIQETAEQ